MVLSLVHVGLRRKSIKCSFMVRVKLPDSTMDEKKQAKPPRSQARDEQVELSSGNVFADLGFRDADERLRKRSERPRLMNNRGTAGSKRELLSDGLVRTADVEC